jgi:hypothetical protein
MKLLLALFLLSPAALAASEELPAGWPALPVVDAHTHADLGGHEEPFSKIPETLAQFLKELKEIGGVGAVGHGASGVRKLEPELASLPLYQCYGVRQKVNVADVEKALKSNSARCIKIYLGYIHRFAYDRAYRPLYPLAAKYDVPVVFHTGDTYSTKGKLKYADPLTIDEVAVDFPKTTFVIAHLGNPWIESAAEVTYKNPNVFVEASALMIGDLTNQEDVDTYLVKPLKWAYGYVGDSSKFMYGTDWPLVSMKAYFEAYKKAIPEKDWCKVFFGNAVRVFRMKELEKYRCPKETP